MESLKSKEIDVAKLKERRNELGLTLEQVAEQVGVTRQTVSNYEQGHGLPSVNVFIRLCSLYKIEVQALAKNN